MIQIEDKGGGGCLLSLCNIIPLPTFVGFLLKARSFSSYHNMGLSLGNAWMFSIAELQNAVGYYLSVQLSQNQTNTLCPQASNHSRHSLGANITT